MNGTRLPFPGVVRDYHYSASSQTSSPVAFPASCLNQFHKITLHTRVTYLALLSSTLPQLVYVHVVTSENVSPRSRLVLEH
jgi:hypothetical protein